MPFQIDVTTRTGIVKFGYTISTPHSSDTERIVPELPTVLFIHPVCTTQIIYHSQFADSKLRKFNLVSFGLREHSETVGPKIPSTYDAEEAARDTVNFMDALELPPCHIYAMASATTIALQLVVSHPKKVLSLFLVSQLCLDEIPEVAEGHTEIYEYWKSAFPDPSTVHDDILKDALFGNVQYAYTSVLSDLAGSILKCAYPKLQGLWGYEHLDVSKIMVHDFITYRKGHSRDVLAKIQCPVKIAYGTNDVAYPLEYTEKFVQDLKGAGVDATLITIQDAPHFACVDYGHVLNPVLHDLVAQITESSGDGSLLLPPTPTEVVSPWDIFLRQAGWQNEDDDDDDDLVCHYQRSLG